MAWTNSQSTGSPVDSALSPDGSALFVAGTRAGSRADIGLAAYSASAGTILWNVTWGGAAGSDDYPVAVAVTPDGSKVIVAGISANRNVSFSDFPVGMDVVALGFDAATGALLWNSFYNGPLNAEEATRDLVVSPDGARAFVVGRTQVGSDNLRAHDGLIVAFDTGSGAKLWTSTLAGTRGDQDELSAGGISADGAAVYATGIFDATSTYRDMPIVAYDATTGARMWLHTYSGAGSTSHEMGTAIGVAGSRVIASGSSGNDFATVAVHAADGTRSWASRLTAGGASASGLEVAGDGSRVFITGTMPGGNGYSKMTTVAYAPSNGAKLWQTTDDSYDSSSSDLVVDPISSRVYVTGRAMNAEFLSSSHTVAYNATTGARAWQIDNELYTGGILTVSGDSTKLFFATGHPTRMTVVAYATGIVVERHELRLSPASQNDTHGAAAYSRTDYPLVLENAGNRPENVSLALSSPSSGWTSSLRLDGQPVTNVQLAPGQNVTLSLVVESKLRTPSGGTWANVTALSGGVSVQASTWTSKEAPVDVPVAIPAAPCGIGSVSLPEWWCWLFG